jgi:2-iminobutanoate/2-iminopropanoate deaminase
LHSIQDVDVGGGHIDHRGIIALMNRAVSPEAIAPPAANYAHAMVVESASATLHTSGVVPIRPDGTVPDDIVAQADVVWTNLLAILGDAGMVPADVVSITTYVVVDHLGALGTVMAARDRALDGHRAASTLVTVPALARPEWKMEIALVAARAAHLR